MLAPAPHHHRGAHPAGRRSGAKAAQCSAAQRGPIVARTSAGTPPGGPAQRSAQRAGDQSSWHLQFLAAAWGLKTQSRRRFQAKAARLTSAQVDATTRAFPRQSPNSGGGGALSVERKPFRRGPGPGQAGLADPLVVGDKHASSLDGAGQVPPSRLPPPRRRPLHVAACRSRRPCHWPASAGLSRNGHGMLCSDIKQHGQRPGVAPAARRAGSLPCCRRAGACHAATGTPPAAHPQSSVWLLATTIMGHGRPACMWRERGR